MAAKVAAGGGGGGGTFTIYPTVDGFITSSNATYSTARAGSGLTVDTTGTTTIAGQFVFSGTYYLRESFFSFDTSAVTGTVSSVTLSFVPGGQSLATPITLEVRRHNWGPTLTTADWVAGADMSSKTLVASFNATAANWSGSAYIDMTSDAAFLTNINQAGTTDIVVCSNRFTSGTSPTAGEYLLINSTETSGTSQDPKLVIVTT